MAASRKGRARAVRRGPFKTLIKKLTERRRSYCRRAAAAIAPARPTCVRRPSYFRFVRALERLEAAEHGAASFRPLRGSITPAQRVWSRRIDAAFLELE